MTTLTDTGGVKSAFRVLQLLEYFAQTRRPATAAELRKQLDLPKSSCFALMETLRDAGYVYWVGRDFGYYPTQRWFNLARAVSEHDPVLLVAAPTLAAIRDATDETVILAKLDDTRVLYLDVVESTQIIRFSATAGQHKPVHPASSGRALLAAMAPPEREALIARLTLTRFTAATSTSVRRLNAQIEEGITRGWHVNLGEHQVDTASVAVTFTLGIEHYALVVGAPLHRIRNRIDRIGRELASHARALNSRDLRAQAGV